MNKAPNQKLRPNNKTPLKQLHHKILIIQSQHELSQSNDLHNQIYYFHIKGYAKSNFFIVSISIILISITNISNLYSFRRLC